jgi:CRISPR-associated protein Csd2
MICSSVNLNRFIVRPSFRPDSNHAWRKIRGSRHFVSAPLASHETKGTGFSEDDLELLWQALGNMFDHDRSAARGEMATRKLIFFRHESKLGNAQAQSLFDRVKTRRVHSGQSYEIGSDGYLKNTDNWPPARQWSDYAVTVEREGLPGGVEIIERT